MRYYTLEQIINKYNKATLKEKVGIMWSALGYKDQWNGRADWLCVAMAMGFDNDEGVDGKYYKR